MKKVALALIIILVFAGVAFAGECEVLSFETYQKTAGASYGGDTSGKTAGDQVFLDDGSSGQIVGDQILFNNGSTGQIVGDQVFFNNGSTGQVIGDQISLNNGRTGHIVGGHVSIHGGDSGYTEVHTEFCVSATVKNSSGGGRFADSLTATLADGTTHTHSHVRSTINRLDAEQMAVFSTCFKGAPVKSVTCGFQ
jgi:hypothetical protein